jgi:hypothetical protein
MTAWSGRAVVMQWMLSSPAVFVFLHFQLDWGCRIEHKKSNRGAVRLRVTVFSPGRDSDGTSSHSRLQTTNLLYPLLLSHTNELVTRKASCGMQTANAK